MTENWFAFVPRWLTRVSEWVRDAAGVVLVGMMLITVYDIVARSVGLGSIEAVIELTTMGVVIVASFGMAIVTIQAGHILIDLFTSKNKAKTNRLIDGLWLLIMGVTLVVIAYLSGKEGLTLHGEHTTTEVLEWTVLTFYLPPIVGWILCGVAAIWIGMVVLIRRGNLAETDHDQRSGSGDGPAL